MSSSSAPMPTGTVTFLLTDIEGSTRAWAADPDTTGVAVVRHYELLAQAIVAHGGFRPVEQGEGDSAVAVFARPSDAVAAAVAAQRALLVELGEVVTVRMALHSGETHVYEGTYLGPTIIRTAAEGLRPWWADPVVAYDRRHGGGPST